MSKDRERDLTRFSADDADRILRRAVVIDGTRRATLSADDLRLIAAELDLTPEALDAALNEVASSGTSASPSAETPGRIVKDMVGMAVLGASIIVISDMTSTAGPAWLIAPYAALLVRGLMLKGGRKYLRIATSGIGMWAGLVLGVVASPQGNAGLLAVFPHLVASAGCAMVALMIKSMIHKMGGGSGGSVKGEIEPGWLQQAWLRTLKSVSRWLGDGPARYVQDVLAASLARQSTR